MRNPKIQKTYAELMCDYNFSPKARELVSVLHPMNKGNLFIHQVINVWGPILSRNLPIFKNVLLEAKKSGKLDPKEADDRLNTIEEIKKTLLFDGYLNHF